MSHRKILFIVGALILFSFCLVYAQNPEWVVYDTSNSGLPSNNISCIAIDDSGNKWIGTGDYYGDGGNGMARFDGTNWTVYNTSNSDLPSNAITSIVIDNNNNKWIGTDGGGLARFDGTNWTVYNTSNSGIPSDWINCITIDSSSNKWIGMHNGIGGLAKFDGINWTGYDPGNSGLPSRYVDCIAIDDYDNKWIGSSEHHMLGADGNGLVRFDGINWTVFDTSNSDLPGNWIRSIAIDSIGNMWIGTGLLGKWPRGTGLARFDGTTLIVYDTSNSGLHSNNVSSIAIDESGNKWIGTRDARWGLGGDGVAKFDGADWTVYNTSNSGLSSDQINCITIDSNSNKWFGTDAGLAVFKEGGVVSVEENSNPKSQIPTHIALSQNYPNPFNPVTTINYELPVTCHIELSIYNLLGQKVATLVSSKQAAGRYNVQWDGSEFASGVYFFKIKTGAYNQTRKMVLIQ